MSARKLSVLITGSNQGLGYESARQLSKREDIHLFISGRNPSRVQEALEKITKDDGRKATIDSILLDVSDDDSVKAAVKELEKKLGDSALDVLVNNSGLHVDKEIPTIGLRAAFEKCYAVNVFGTAITTNAFLPLLKKSKTFGGPRILNLSSGLGSIGLTSNPEGKYKGSHALVYNSSKSALNGVTCTQAMANPDIHFVLLDPGYNSTALNGFAGPMDPKDGVQVIINHVLETKGKSPGYFSNGGEVPW